MDVPPCPGVHFVPYGVPSGRPVSILCTFPSPSTAILFDKWNYIFKRFQVYYKDSDGDNITLGSYREFLDAIAELTSTPPYLPRFHFRQGSLTGETLLLKMSDEFERVKIRFKVIEMDFLGRTTLEMDIKTRQIPSLDVPDLPYGEQYEEETTLPDDDVDPAILNEPVPNIPQPRRITIGNSVIVGGKVNIGTDYFANKPQHQGTLGTVATTPPPSPPLKPSASDEIPLIELESKSLIDSQLPIEANSNTSWAMTAHEKE